MPKVLVIATSRKTRGGITSVIKAHETGEQWKKYHCVWIQTNRDGNSLIKIVYFISAFIQFCILLPFYDIVHIHCAAGTSAKRKVVFAKIAKIIEKKVLVHFHPPAEKVLFENPWREPAHRLFSLADKILVLSPRWESLIHKAMPDVHCPIEVVYNPAPLVKRNKDNCYLKKYILFAGTIIKRKGYDSLIQAFSIICNQFPDWKLKFAGNGEIELAKKLRKELNIPSSQVEFLGWIKGEDKNYVFNNASIYCLPSLGEGFPMGVLDAIAYGVPVVTTPVGGIEDVLKNNIDCMITPVNDIVSLADTLKELMQNESIRLSLAENADKHLNKEFCLKTINKQLDDIYSNLLCQD